MRIWPDNDEVGAKYAADVATILRALGCTVTVLDAAAMDLPAKGDAADWASPATTLADLDVLPWKRWIAEGIGTQDEPMPQSEEGAGDAGVALTNDEGRPRPQAEVLIDLGRQHYLFHDSGGEAFTRVTVGNRHAVYLVNSNDYREHLAREFYTLSGKGCNRNAPPMPWPHFRLSRSSTGLRRPFTCESASWTMPSSSTWATNRRSCCCHGRRAEDQLRSDQFQTHWQAPAIAAPA